MACASGEHASVCRKHVESWTNSEPQGGGGADGGEGGFEGDALSPRRRSALPEAPDRSSFVVTTQLEGCSASHRARACSMVSCATHSVHEHGENGGAGLGCMGGGVEGGGRGGGLGGGG